MPPPRARASSAAMAGIGDALPTAMWRTLPIRRVITSARSSSSRIFDSGLPAIGYLLCNSRCAAGMYVLREITRKPLLARSQASVFAKVRQIGPIVVGQAERPTAVLCDRDRLHVEARQRAGGEHRIV